MIASNGRDWPSHITSVHAFRGERDRTFERLEQAIDSGDSGPGEILPECLFDRLHSDPRRGPFLRKLGKARGGLAKIPFKVTAPEWNAGNATPCPNRSDP